MSGVSAVSAVSDVSSPLASHNACAMLRCPARTWSVEVSAGGEVYGGSAPFAMRGRGMTIGVEWAEVKGLPKNASVYLDVYVVSNSGQETAGVHTIHSVQYIQSIAMHRHRGP
eukprot:2083123-Rhodomonas_salina.1